LRPASSEYYFNSEKKKEEERSYDKKTPIKMISMKATDIKQVSTKAKVWCCLPVQRVFIVILD
jgi:hypothetical protein